ncbi:MAG: class I tRNA ligase family protein [Bacteroidota bacterium]|nr:class I tRNA ligase family protein [Bacteroidota bacterium]
MEYDFREVEKKWQAYWAEKKTFKTEDNSSKPKYFVLDMFPYPSGAGLHVGHPLGYIASDIFARYKRLKGFNVLHPMGYDSFGLPAEQYAIQTGQHPRITTENNIARYREQLDKIGFSFDWDREVRTSDPQYYKWTQWIFIQLFNSWYNKKSNKAEKIETLIAEFEKAGNGNINAACELTEIFSSADWNAFSEKDRSDILLNYRLAFLSNTMVNWCPQLGTVLANEEVKEGVSERGGYPVERKLMKQWSLRITAYADRLLTDLDALDWTESIKEAQRNWIGKSEGTSLKFKVQSSKFEVEVFTTRPDTLFGVSFVTLAPEHELVEKLTTPEQKKAVDEYITFAKNRSERERMADVKKITGVFTGAYVIHPFTGKQVPIWIGDYVLAGYGTGAVMAVPAHDSRDYAFANHFGIDKLVIIQPPLDWNFDERSFDEKEGKLINSDFLNGLEVKAAIKKIIAVIEERGLGKGKTNFRLRDAIFGRQRYWGEPIPVYYENGIPKVLSENELPLLLPEVDKYLPTETGEPPLARAKDWKYKGEFEYEYSTMPGWAGSSWYFLRYMDAHNNKTFASKEAVDYWQNVDLYIGGAEHATGHLLYIRFWTKFLNDLGLIPVAEPAKKLINQGMIQGVSEKIYQTYVGIHVDSKNEPTEHRYFENIVLPDGDYTTVISADCISQYGPTLKFPSNVDINFVKNNILDIEKYINWQKGNKNTVFIFKDCYLYENVFYNFKGNKITLIAPPSFYTISEVEKMSKSKWNVVSPDKIVEEQGADCLRLYEMFLGPLEQSKPWSTSGISGVSNFIRKLWRLYHSQSPSPIGEGRGEVISEEPATRPELKTLHKTIKKIAQDIENFSFNTSVSSFMICVNELTEFKCNKREVLEPLAILMAPYAPHIAEELWNKLGNTDSITYATFPICNEDYLVESSFNYPISFNGKTRFFQEYDRSLSKEDVEKEVLDLDQTQKYLEGKAPKKVIVVHNKIVNIVI